jgi:hypothetical protein
LQNPVALKSDGVMFKCLLTGSVAIYDTKKTVSTSRNDARKKQKADDNQRRSAEKTFGTERGVTIENRAATTLCAQNQASLQERQQGRMMVASGQIIKSLQDELGMIAQSRKEARADAALFGDESAPDTCKHWNSHRNMKLEADTVQAKIEIARNSMSRFTTESSSESEAMNLCNSLVAFTKPNNKRAKTTAATVATIATVNEAATTIATVNEAATTDTVNDDDDATTNADATS